MRVLFVALLCVLSLKCSTGAPCYDQRLFIVEADKTHKFKAVKDFQLLKFFSSSADRVTAAEKEIDVDLITLKTGSLLLHGTFPTSVTPAQLISNTAGMASWFSPNECQSTGHACKTAHDSEPHSIKYFMDYYSELGSPKPAEIPMVTYVFKIYKDIKLVHIKNSLYPVIVKNENGIAHLAGSSSSEPAVDKMVDQFCAYAQSVGAVGWRQDDDQDEVMLCGIDRSQFLQLEEEYKYVCLESDVSHSSRPDCPDKKMLYGQFTVQSCQWTRHFKSECKDNKVVCTCTKDDEVPKIQSNKKSQKGGNKKSGIGSFVCGLLEKFTKKKQL